MMNYDEAKDFLRSLLEIQYDLFLQEEPAVLNESLPGIAHGFEEWLMNKQLQNRPEGAAVEIRGRQYSEDNCQQAPIDVEHLEKFFAECRELQQMVVDWANNKHGLTAAMLLNHLVVITESLRVSLMEKHNGN